MNMITVGMDISDKKIEICVINHAGDVLKRTAIATKEKDIKKFVSGLSASEICVALETGTHSPWISRLLESLGCEVIVANARKLAAVWTSDRKSDPADAEILARLARFDRHLLAPIRHRSERCQLDLSLIKTRETFMKQRKNCINAARGIAKSFGVVFPDCGGDTFAKNAKPHVPLKLRASLGPLLDLIATLTVEIKELTKSIEQIQKDRYPEAEILMQINGVGPLTSLCFILTIECAGRFKKSRTVGAFLGIVPKRDQSGQTDKQLHISKAGDKYLRTLLVSCAQHVLGHRGKDSEIRRTGFRIMSRGGKIAKKKAVIAVARKLAILMHKLWKTGDTYDPFYHANNKRKQAA